MPPDLPLSDVVALAARPSFTVNRGDPNVAARYRKEGARRGGGLAGAARETRGSLGGILRPLEPPRAMVQAWYRLDGVIRPTGPGLLPTSATPHRISLRGS